MHIKTRTTPPTCCFCCAEVLCAYSRETIRVLPCHHQRNRPRTPFPHWFQWGLIETQQDKHSYMLGTTLMLPLISSSSHKHIEQQSLWCWKMVFAFENKDAIPLKAAIDILLLSEERQFVTVEKTITPKALLSLLLLLLIYQDWLRLSQLFIYDGILISCKLEAVYSSSQ